MKFVVTWTYDPDHFNPVLERFQETGGPPPEGVTMKGRWHDVAGGRGFLLCESDDPVAVGRWCHQWADLIDFQVVPVLEDEELAAAAS